MKDLLGTERSSMFASRPSCSRAHSTDQINIDAPILYGKLNYTVGLNNARFDEQYTTNPGCLLLTNTGSGKTFISLLTGPSNMLHSLIPTPSPSDHGGPNTSGKHKQRELNEDSDEWVERNMPIFLPGI